MDCKKLHTIGRWTVGYIWRYFWFVWWNLLSHKFNTILFQNPVKALEYFYTNASNYSLVIVDYKMSQMSNRFYQKDNRKRCCWLQNKTHNYRAFIKDISLMINPIQRWLIGY